MNWTDLNLIPAMPEIVLLTALCAVLLVDLWLPDEKRGITAGLAILGVLAAAVFQVALWPGEPVETFNAMFVLDGMSYVAKLAVYAVVLVLFVVSRGYLKARQIYKGEFYSLTMFALLGMCVMVSANHFLTLYIGLELLSLSLYALIALRREDTRASEAALKYFVLGALASLLVGNLAAVMQTNIKRMLAYSTVSHMGFVLLAFMGGLEGFSAALYYALTYALMALTGFGVLMLLSREGRDCEEIADLAGLNQRHPWYAFLMLLVMFSMAGIPPLMGFYAKFAVLKALVAAQYSWALWLAVFAVVMSLIGAFYYLRVVRTMYFDEKTDDAPLSDSVLLKCVLSVNALLLLVWGILPYSLIEWIRIALEHSF